jgi:exopolysaccharide production protein ExoZ
MKKFATIQLLRAFACLYVLAGHLIFFWGLLFPTTHLFTILFYHGYSGVDLFFVISGFVIYTSTQHLGEGFMPFLGYLKKRLIRIYPIYWIILLCLFLTIGTEYPLSFKTLLFTFLLVPGHPPVIDVTW